MGCLTTANGSPSRPGIEHRVGDGVSVGVLSSNLSVDSRIDLAVDHCGLCHYRRHVTCQTANGPHQMNTGQ